MTPKLAGIVGLVSLLLLFGEACGSADDERVETRPLEDIIASPAQITDLTPTSAVVRSETTVDVVCSVVFGVDTAYGRQSTDLDMGGRAHRSHAAPLRGLEPDTVYHYRLQGSGSDGTVYVSEDMTFSTPPASQSSQDPSTNLARSSAGARIVESSSQFGDSPTWRPENAIDGDPVTEWSSDGDGDDAYIVVELAERSDLAAVGLWTRTMGSSGQIASFRVITEDGTELGPFELPDSGRMHVFPVSVSAQILRFEVVQSSGGNTGVVELGAYGRD